MLYNKYGSNAPQYAVWASGTYNKGVAPCKAVVTGDGGGGFAVLDSTNAVLFSAGAYSPAGTPYGQLPVGGTVLQVWRPAGGHVGLAAHAQHA